MRPFELTAASDVLVDSVNVAGLPLQNFVTVLNALAGAAGGSTEPAAAGPTSLQALPNLLYSQLVAGTLTRSLGHHRDRRRPGHRAGRRSTNLAATPGEIIATDIEAINKLLADLGLGRASARSAEPWRARPSRPPQLRLMSRQRKQRRPHFGEYRQRRELAAAELRHGAQQRSRARQAAATETAAAEQPACRPCRTSCTASSSQAP